MKSTRVLSLTNSTMLAAFVLLFSVATAHGTYAGKNGRIAFVSNLSGTYQLYTINPDGSDMRQITNLPTTGNSLWTPDYSPDGRQIVFSHDMTGALEMYVINADGTGLTQVTHDGLADFFARWSPDGQRFVFLSVSLKNGAGVITTMRTDGSDRVVLTDDIPYDSIQPEYTPDGKQIVFTSQAGGLVSALWIMDADGSHKRRLTDPRLEAGGPALSPDGKRLAFYTSQDTPKPTDVWVMLAVPSICTR
jgi:Tol biopolymer transport system component